MSDRLRCAALIGLLALTATSAAAQPATRHVLVLQSFDRGNLILDHFSGDFRVDLEQRVGGPVNFVQVVVGPTGFVGAPEQSVVNFIRSTFVDRPKPDLIVTIAGPAATFARKYRRQLFPDAPLLLASVDQRYLGDAPLAGNETAVAVLADFPGLVDDILQVQPRTRQVFMVVGSGVIGKFWRHRLEEQFSRFRDRLTFVWWDEVSLPELLRVSSSLPAHSAIFYFTFGTDAAGAAYADARVLADLHAKANAPLFAAHSVYLGSGIVGGRLLSIDELARRTADSAYRILNGASPSDLSVLPQRPGQPTFDWRELQRWDIPESRLPPGSMVRHRAPSLWSEYKAVVLSAAAALLIQALLVIGLLFQRRARRKAEIDSRRNLVLATDTGRRETISALSGSMAHELSQPLTAMIHGAETLRMLLDASPTTPEIIGEILSDIHASGMRAAKIIERHRTMLRSRQLQKKPIDLHAVLHDTLALVAHDMRARQVEVTLRLPSTACAISADPVLLQQVLVNLLMNAMDAMAENPPGQRHIEIRAEVRHADVQIAVSDNGAGLPAELIGRLFTPFVTTKPHGLGMGLVIARSIVEAHGGSIRVGNHPERGATFTVTLRTGEVWPAPGPPMLADTVRTLPIP